MKWFVFLVVFLLNWAALDDITTGSEPGLWGEWAVVTVTGTAVFLFVVCWLLRKLVK